MPFVEVYYPKHISKIDSKSGVIFHLLNLSLWIMLLKQRVVLLQIFLRRQRIIMSNYPHLLRQDLHM